MVTLIRIILVLAFAGLCAAGGQGIKQLRRFVAPLVFSGGIAFLAFITHLAVEVRSVIWVALGLAWYCPSLIIFKYGVNDGKLWKKILLRGIYGFSLGVSGLFIGIGTGHILLGGLQLILATAGSIVFGCINPFPNKWGNLSTVSEDICIYSLTVILVPWMIR